MSVASIDQGLVALLPMKAHSQRVSGKNFRLLGGRPLFRWMLDALLSIPAIDTIVINTVAWVGILSSQKIMNVVLSSYSLKILIALGLTPLIYLAHALVQRGFGIEPVLLDDSGEPILSDGAVPVGATVRG